MWCLVVVSMLISEDPTLPTALPPLDDALLRASDDGGDLRAFGHGRARAVAEDADDDAFAGAGLTARVGASGALGDVRGTVVVGDGGWWVTPTSPSSAPAAPLSPVSLTLVPPPLSSFIQRLSVEVPLSPLGTAGQLVVGRFPLVVADGRFVGVEPFDARGRTVDGAVIDTALAPVLVKAGVVALDLGAGALARDPGFSALGFADAGLDMPSDDRNFDDVNVDVYLLLHHSSAPRADGATRGPDGTIEGATGPPTLRPTLGARGGLDVWGLHLQAGLDGQLALDETKGLARTGAGLHGELTARTLLPWTFAAPRPFLEAGVEGTGDVVAPAPSQHGTLGDLDLLGFRNTWQVLSRVGVIDDASGFQAFVAWRLVSALSETTTDPRGLPAGNTIGPRFAEVDVGLALPVAAGVDVDVGWSVAVDRVVARLRAQRVLIGLRFSFGDDDGLLPEL